MNLHVETGFSVEANIQNYYSQTFNRWKGVYEQLVSTLDTFHTESINLDAVLRQYDTQAWAGLEESLAFVDTAHTSLKKRYLQIQNSRAALGTVRNRSRSLARLNKLPVEIIQHILEFADTRCIIKHSGKHTFKEYAPSPLYSLANSCRYLRQVLTGIPSLWTHIDLVLDCRHAEAYARHARACLVYSAGLPLHVHFAENADPDKVKMCSIGDLIEVLVPYAHQIGVLDLRILVHFAREVIIKLITGIGSSQLRELFIVNRVPDSRGLNPSLCQAFFQLRGDRYPLPNLRTLVMCTPYVPLASSVYRGLSILKLEPQYPRFDRLRPTIFELAFVLAACPDLRALSLIGCDFRVRTQAVVEPVLLSKLEILDLRGTSGEDELVALISCIVTAPESNELALSITYTPDMPDNKTDKLREFINRSNVTRLLLDATRQSGDTVPWLIGPIKLPTVRELAFSKCRLRDQVPGFFFGVPNLHTLHLLYCIMEIEILGPVIESSTIQVLELREHWNMEQFSRFVPSVKHHHYPDTSNAGVDLEWPVAIA